MNSLRIALCILRVPRLFLVFLFFPLLLSLVVVYLQLLVTGMFAGVMLAKPETVEKVVNETKDSNFVRLILYGDPLPRPAIKECRWVLNAEGHELPTPECQPDRLDVALQVEDPVSFDASSYLKMFNGNIERLHICRTCAPDIIIRPLKSPIETDIKSIWALSLVSVSMISPEIKSSRLDNYRSIKKLTGLLGQQVLLIPGLQKPISINAFGSLLLVITNGAFLVIMALWLALRSHRKVLDYFGRSGALLPLVSACGKESFYGALWFITILRVVAFLGAALPLTVSHIIEMSDASHLKGFFGDSGWLIAFWVIALTGSLALAAVTSSMADLKQNQISSLTLRYVPLLLAALGALVWSTTLLFEGPIALFTRQLITALPIAGLAPVLVVPVVTPKIAMLAVHALGSVLIIWGIFRHNARWFAAHLDEF